GKISCSVSKVNGISGMRNLGSEPLTDAISTTFLVSISKKYTTPKTINMATSEAGTALVIFGNKTTMAIVNAVSPAIAYSAEPCIQPSTPFSDTLNCATCAMKIMTASPFRKPYITGWGINRTNLPSLNTPTNNWRIPPKITAPKRYSTPWVAANAISTTTVAPAPPETIPGRPPRMEVTNPIKKAA